MKSRDGKNQRREEKKKKDQRKENEEKENPGTRKDNKNSKIFFQEFMDMENRKIRPHRRCWGVIFRMALVKGYRFTWGGEGIFRPKPPVFDRSWCSPLKNTVKNSTEDTCSWTRPSKISKRKVKKNPCFSTFWPQFFGLQYLFLRFRRWPGPEADFWVFGPVFGLIFVVLW